MSDPGLTPTRYARVRALFDGALELEPAERAAFLERASGGDRSLADEAASLLAALARGGETWDSPAGAFLAGALADAGESGQVGRRIGPYALRRLVGVGGMGAVYEGVRVDDQFHQRVAVKLLRAGLDGDLAVRRFRYERQILANLNHPNVASLLDGGVAADGQPYFVMEYVDGEPITAYCARHRLDVRARVRLLLQVCAAVQHAHQHLVVHRDLKPGNVLVDADGRVKLLDFGIARLLREGEGPDQLPPTQGGARAFTPDYASPEQVRGLPVATASDVYSLGVIASELLSGHRPFELQGRLFAEMQETICLAPAPAPSTLVRDEDAAALGARTAARARAQLVGDLDAIVLQALRKEPERRYGSVEQLGRDLQRHLDGLPVSAQRDRLGYRVGKLLRRRRVEFAAGAVVLVALAAGLVATTRAARRAQLERAKMEQVNEFLAGMLGAVDPGAQGRDVTVAQVLSQAAQDVAGDSLDPEIEAQIRHTLAQTYYELGHYDSAAVHARRAFDLRRRVLGERHQQTIFSLSYVSALAEARGEYAQAESLSRASLAMQRRLDDPGQLATALDNLARMITHQGRLDEARALQLQAVAIRRRSDDPESREALPITLSNLSVSYSYAGDLPRALELAREAVAADARVHGRASATYGNLLRTLASTLDDNGRPAEADSVVRESIAVLRAALGERHPDYLRSVNLLAALRFAADDMPGTVAAAREVVGQIGGALHESDQAAAVALQTLGLALDSLRQHAAADSALRRSLALRRAYLPAEHWAIASSESLVGYHLGRTGRHVEGERMMRDAYARIAAARGEEATVTRRLALRLAELLEQMGRPEDAAAWRARG